MGAWSVSITGNDTASDLRSEYQAAFYYNDVDLALAKIDAYVREDRFNESDESEWCNYYYSLTNFMWDKGILTDAVRDEALNLIDRGFGLDIYEEAGIKTLNDRKKVLENFRKKITSQQPPKKKIKIDMYIKPVIVLGDVLALQLQTLDKPYLDLNDNIWCGCKISEEDFRALSGKYVAVIKVADHVSYTSKIEPKVRNIWPHFRLYKKIFNDTPSPEDLVDLDLAVFTELCGPGPKADVLRTNETFYCEGSIFYFRKRKYSLICNNNSQYKSDIGWSTPIALCARLNVNADLQFINAIYS